MKYNPLCHDLYMFCVGGEAAVHSPENSNPSWDGKPEMVFGHDQADTHLSWTFHG